MGAASSTLQIHPYPRFSSNHASSQQACRVARAGEPAVLDPESYNFSEQTAREETTPDHRLPELAIEK